MVIIKVVDILGSTNVVKDKCSGLYFGSEYNQRVKLCIEIDHNVGFRKN